MNLALRRVHRSAFAGLMLFLPALLVGAWRVRREPVWSELPAELLPGQETPRTPDHVPTSDELVYWIDAEGGEDAENWRDLPPGAELAGTVRSGALGLSPPEGKRAVTYSLAHRRVLATLEDLRAGAGERP